MGEIIRKEKVNKMKFRNICSSTVSPDNFTLVSCKKLRKRLIAWYRVNGKKRNDPLNSILISPIHTTIPLMLSQRKFMRALRCNCFPFVI